MRDTLEIIIHRWVRTIRNMRRANQLADALDNQKAFAARLID